MSSLLTALQTAGTALRGFEKAIGVVQTNVLNASTAGYARQQLQMSADAFDPNAGYYGGLETGDVETSRSTYSEQSVQQENQLAQYYDELYTVLSPLQQVFDLKGTTGMSSSLTAMFDAFSAWSQAPNHTNTRQNVISSASAVATQFRLAYSQLASDGDSIRSQAVSTVSKINGLAQDIAVANQSIITSKGSGGALNDSTLYAALEELSGLVNVSYVQANDGTYTVLLDGQVPLVVGETTYSITSSTTPNAAGIPTLEVSSSEGPITSLLTGGALGAELSAYNGTLTSLLGGATSTGSLNDLAAAVATTVNNILLGGETAAGVAGEALFTVPAGIAAASCITTTAITEADLGAVDTASGVGNGIPLALAGLSTAVQTVGTSANVSLTDYLAGVAADLGRQISTADSSTTRQAELLSQAKSLRSGVSGVSLDQEAAELMAFQQSYSATAQVFSAVNRMLDTLMGIVK